MSALEAFRRTGEVGDELALLTFRTVRLVATTYNFPHPGGGNWSSDDDVWDAVAGFLAGHDGIRRLATLCTQATNDRHLASLLETTVLRWFQTLGRRSERGRLIRALEGLMSDEEAFVEIEADKFWALRDGPRAATTVPLDELVAASWTVHLDVIRARPEAKKRSPFAPREQRVALLTAILDSAGGAVHISDIAETVTARVGLLEAPTYLSLDAPDSPELVIADQRVPMEQSDHARELFAQLGHRERIALANLDAPLRETAARFDIPRSSLQDAKARVVEILSQQIVPADSSLARSLHELCEAYAESRTARDDLASTSQPEDDL